MINLTDEQWNVLFDEVDKTIQKALDDLPSLVRERAEQIDCLVDKYHNRDEWKDRKVLGCYMQWTNGPIMIYAGQIHEDCSQITEETMKSVRQVYYHELAHAIGDLAEHEVRERGL